MRQRATVRRARSPDAVGATPLTHGAVTRLMEEAVIKLAAARTHMQTADADEVNRPLHWAMGIIGALQEALVHDAGQEAAARLDALYEYMHGQLFAADRHNDAGPLEEVARLLATIRDDREWIALHNPALGSAEA